GCCMCQSPRRAWCGAMSCIIRPTQRRSRGAGPTSGTRPWPCRRLWSGRPCAPSAVTCIRNGVRPVVSSWCARALSHGEEHLPAWHQRSAPHEIHTTGETCQGCRVPGGSEGTETTACQQCPGAADAPSTAIAPARVGSADPGTSRMTEGGPQVNSIAQGCQNLVAQFIGDCSSPKTSIVS